MHKAKGSSDNKQIRFFFRASDFLSNWYICSFVIEGICYSSVEQYMMASKAALFGDRVAWDAIMNTDKPREQQTIGRAVNPFDETTWDNQCQHIVHQGVTAKFRQNPKLLKRLLDTGDSVLAEASDKDFRWAIGYKSNEPRAQNIKLWPGFNWLGHILTHVRTCERNKLNSSCVSLQNDEPKSNLKPDICVSKPLQDAGLDNRTIESRMMGPRHIEAVIIENVVCNSIIDTGSCVSSITEAFHIDNLPNVKLHDLDEVFDGQFRLTGATGTTINVIGYVEVDVLFPGLESKIPIIMTVFKDSILDESTPALIGTNAIDEWKSALRMQYKSQRTTPTINEVVDNWILEGKHIGVVHNISNNKLKSDQSVTLIQGEFIAENMRAYSRQVLFSPRRCYEDPRGILMDARVLHIPANETKVKFDIAVQNLKPGTRTLSKGSIMGVIEPIAATKAVLPNEEVSHDQDTFFDAFNLAQYDWTADEAQKVKEVLWKYKDAFALDSHQLGKCNIEEHVIEIDDPQPFKEKYRRIPPAMYESVKLEIQKMLENKVIRPSYSPFSSPITVVTKKDGTPRVCVDFRRLNSRTKKDAKSIPRIDETLDSLSGSRYFTSLDLMSGYWQTAMDEGSKELTAFTAGPLGFYEFNRMPFGLCNAGATFQRMMERVLQPLINIDCLVYIDDIVVYSKDIDLHLIKLSRVLSKLIEHGLRLKPKKCAFMKREITFLGHSVSSEGISKDPSKVEAIRDWARPTSVAELRRFLGLTGYMRRYVRDYAKISQPLT